MNKHASVAVAATQPEQQAQAEQLAARLQLDYLSHLTDAPILHDYLLLLTPDYLGLQKTGEKQSPFYIDFLSGKLYYRSQQAGLRKELLARAMGLRPKEAPRIVDATAGLGRDSFILAVLGFEVTLIERSGILHALLDDAIKRARQASHMVSVMDRLHLIQADAIHWLQATSTTLPKPDIIYLDPMFPLRQKSASVKKEMVILQDLLGKDEDADSLFELALTCAARRVVVKRPRLANAIDQRLPNFSLTGKSSRFDIYLSQNA